MKVRASELKILDFQIIKSEYRFIPPEKGAHLVPGEILEALPFDVDYTINSLDENTILIFLKCEINRKEQAMPGYYLFAEGVTIFDISVAKEAMEKEELDGFITFSGVSIALNNMRNFLQQMTISGPFHAFLLPAIDLNDLVRQKSNQSTEEE